MLLRLGDRHLDVRSRALVMGILNVTPDSAHAPSRASSVDEAVRRVEAMVAEGADIVDIGGVTAAPGEPVPPEVEVERVVPVVEAVVRRLPIAVSVDTWRADVAAAAFAAGACVGNDISGFADHGYLEAAAAAGATVVATHIRLGPRVPDPHPTYDDVVAEVADRLASLLARARAAGLGEGHVLVDAGLGLGKDGPQSLALLRASDRLATLGAPLVVAASRKSFLDEATGCDDDRSRLDASVAAAALAVSLGARIVRTHDVRAVRRVCDVLAAVEEAA